MLYDDEIDYGEPQLDPRDLLEDLTALLDAGLIVPVRGSDGEVRVTPAEPLPWQERSCS
jgi:hypothetical protein